MTIVCLTQMGTSAALGSEESNFEKSYYVILTDSSLGSPKLV